MTVLDELKPQKLFPVAYSLSPLKDFFSKPYLVTKYTDFRTLI
jgi:hypothetical protein